jgi:uncharacterized protein (TIGR02391 family)
MARRTAPDPPKPPSISKAEGRRRLTKLIERGVGFLNQRPLKEGQEDVWSTACIETIAATFGEESSHINTFIGSIRYTFSHSDRYDHFAENRDAEIIQRRIGVLQTLVEQIDLEIGFETPSVTTAFSFWDDIHPSVARVAKGRYEAGQFADCVEAALKEINTLVKDHYRQRTGDELDGAPLMNKTFSPKNPLVVLDDLSTASGRDIQLGYMQLYAGSMTGIRNPKAHGNVTINDVRARHFLYLASLLAYRFHEAVTKAR